MSETLRLVEHFPYMGLFSLLILGGIGLPFPEDITLILSGFLISHNVVKPVPALIVIYSGLLIADLVLYILGREYGRAIVTSRRFHRILSPERFSILEGKFNKKGILFILFGRHLIGLRAQVFLVAGIMRMSILKFMVTDAISSLFTISVMVGAGYTGGKSLQIIIKDITRIEHIVIFLILTLFTTLLTVYLFLRYRKSRRDRRLL